jgi:hypothetical protein
VSARHSVINNELVCAARQLIYDVEERRGFIYVAAGFCTDMSGAIWLFKRVDPHVREVIVVAGGEVDTIYTQLGQMWRAAVLTQDGEWRVGEPAPFDRPRSGGAR